MGRARPPPLPCFERATGRHQAEGEIKRSDHLPLLLLGGVPRSGLFAREDREGCMDRAAGTSCSPHRTSQILLTAASWEGCGLVGVLPASCFARNAAGPPRLLRRDLYDLGPSFSGSRPTFSQRRLSTSWPATSFFSFDNLGLSLQTTESSGASTARANCFQEAKVR
jgi:hypothetical protein